VIDPAFLYPSNVFVSAPWCVRAQQAQQADEEVRGRNSALDYHELFRASYMRVAHISTSDRQGGASVAARRVNAALREQGVASRLLVAQSSSDEPSVDAIAECNGASQYDTADAAIRHVYRDTNRTAVSNTHFSLQVKGVDLRQHPLVQEADVIHLHWVSSFLAPQSIHLLRSLNKPIMWTLHDFEPFTGGCHFPAGCDGYTATCAHCPQLRNDPLSVPANVLRDKLDLLSDADMTLIAPSAWMAARAQESRVFQHAKRMAVIPNCVDTRVFVRQPAAEVRQAFGLAEDATYILCVADQGLQSRKGFDLLGQILQRCSADPRFQAAHGSLLLVGRTCPALDNYHVPFTHLGEVETEQHMALAYSASDLVVLPSLEDNLPNVVLEGLASGAPVVAFGVGGTPEIVVDGTHGRILGRGDVEGMAQAIVALVSDRPALEAMRDRGRALVEASYSYAAVADQHRALYASVLSRQVAPSSVWSLADPGPAMSALLPDLRLYCLGEQVRTLQQQLLLSEQDRRARLEVIETLNAAANARLQLIQHLESVLAERHDLIQRLHAEMLERATLLDAQQSELTDRGAVIEQLDSELRRCQLLNERLDAELAARLTVIETQERELRRRLTLINSLHAFLGFGRRFLQMLMQLVP